ncbi:MAG: methionyl-tRNA formyltransferase [Ignavibacteriales bacterium]|nr:methionyl-tRNA formyltransferase [Ignavibacteriales bacterium]
MGTPEFAVHSLRTLMERSCNVVAVATAPDKPRGRGQQVSFTAVKKFALQHRLPLLQPESMRDPSFVAELKNLHPDLFVVVAFRILPKEVYAIPSRGAFNLHASLLPKFRGAAPINWAIINGETETGVTTFFLQEHVDTGSTILQARVKIGPEETAGELHDKLAEVGAEIVFQTVRLIELGKAEPRQQDEKLASPAPKIIKEHCRIDWSKSAHDVHNFIRGLSPVPCAWTMHEEKLVRIYRSRIVATPASISNSPGALALIDKTRLHVATGGGAVEILELQQEGKRRLGVEEFLRGYRLKEGDRFR